jgi:hypothetical protein
VLGVGRGGYGSGCWSLQCADDRATALNSNDSRQMSAGTRSALQQKLSNAARSFRRSPVVHRRSSSDTGIYPSGQRQAR